MRGHHDGVGKRRKRQNDVDELPRRQLFVRVLEDRLELDRAGRRIDCIIDEEDPPHDGRLAVLRYVGGDVHRTFRSEEHTSELQSLMRISYAVFCLKKKKTQYI